MSKYYQYPCGCSFPVRGELKGYEQPLLHFGYDDINMNCPKVWSLFEAGTLAGVFQLESGHGIRYAKELKPVTIEHLSALTAILRPGCIGGDTKITIQRYSLDEYGKFKSNKVKIRDLYKKFHTKHPLYESTITSCDENNRLLFDNNINNVFFNGIKDVYKPLISLRNIGCSEHKANYNLECTLDHKLLTLNGWRPLSEIKEGERIAVLNTIQFKSHKDIQNRKYFEGEKHFRDVCFYNYQYHCIFCDWLEGTLDVNHIEGNRKTNNKPDNLCFFCPNHHRLYSEGKITKEQVLERRKQYELPNSSNIIWAKYIGAKYIGQRDVYDIEVNGPNHNYLAGNILVHNCLQSKDENGKNLTQKYCDRKNGKEEASIEPIALSPILSPTYNVLIYQEQQILIAKELCGFNLSEADTLRKSVGKKDAKLLFSLQERFIEGARKVGKITEPEAIMIFDWIKAAARYSFNHCLHPKTKVITLSEGEQTLDSVHVGQAVLAPSFKNIHNIQATEFVEIADIHYNYKPLLHVLFDNGTSINCSIDHKFRCINEQMVPLWEIISTDSAVLSLDYKYVKIINITPIGFSKTIDLEVDSPNHVFYADGLAVSNSHSVLYGIRAYKEAYLKLHFPLQFYTSKLKSPRSSKSKDDEVNLIYEMKKWNIPIKLPDLRHLRAEYYNDGNSIYFGLCNIKGFGESNYEKLKIFLENSPDQDQILSVFFEFVIHCARYLTPSIVENLILSGSVDFFELSRSHMLEEYKLVAELTGPQKEILWRWVDANNSGVFV